jgi:hypothetical protein
MRAQRIISLGGHRQWRPEWPTLFMLFEEALPATAAFQNSAVISWLATKSVGEKISM